MVLRLKSITKPTRDGGIDGIGTLRDGILTKKIAIQAKRYSKTVPVSEVRDFRGAIVSNTLAKQGIMITTGTYSQVAQKEAQHAAVPIELIDGNRLAEYVKEAKLGVKIETIEKVTIMPDFFNNL